MAPETFEFTKRKIRDARRVLRNHILSSCAVGAVAGGLNFLAIHSALQKPVETAVVHGMLLSIVAGFGWFAALRHMRRQAS